MNNLSIILIIILGLLSSPVSGQHLEYRLNMSVSLKVDEAVSERQVSGVNFTPSQERKMDLISHLLGITVIPTKTKDSVMMTIRVYEIGNPVELATKTISGSLSGPTDLEWSEDAFSLSMQVMVGT